MNIETHHSPRVQLPRSFSPNVNRSMIWRRRYRQPILVVLAIATFLFLLYSFSKPFLRPLGLRIPQIPHGKPWGAALPGIVKPEEKELVVASVVEDDTTWLDEHFDTWVKNVYVVDNVSAPLTVAVNKGREAMPFLTYLIDRYDSLPDVAIFVHSGRYQWHNEDPMYDGVPVLKRLRLDHVQARGYVALRCTWLMGCPAELHPLHPSTGTDDRSQNERAYAAAFRHIFPGEEALDTIGAHCSSQFAVSRERVRAISKQQYEHVRDWLLQTDHNDQISGRILEYMWHIIFGMPAIDCQDAGECFCQTFGLCNLTCNREECRNRYILPRYATIPNGWPEAGPGDNGWPPTGWAD